MKTSLLIMTAFLMLISCKKDDNTAPDVKVAGTWTVVNTSVQHYSSEKWMDGADSMRIVEIASWISYMNEGELAINDSAMIFSDLKYNMNFANYSYKYQNGITEDSSGLSFAAGAQSKTFLTSYKRINADSLKTVFTATVDSFYYPVAATGVKLFRVADTLYVSTETQYSLASSQNGIPSTRTDFRMQTMKFTKK
jgi:hypothetical protein